MQKPCASGRAQRCPGGEHSSNSFLGTFPGEYEELSNIQGQDFWARSQHTGLSLPGWPIALVSVCPHHGRHQLREFMKR